MKMALRTSRRRRSACRRASSSFPINVKTGQRDLFGEAGVILEAFKPGEEPSDEDQVIGDQVATSNGVPIGRVTRRRAAGKRSRHRRRVDDRHRRPLLSRAITHSSSSDIMRAEITNLVDEMKQSIGLLRRHL